MKFNNYELEYTPDTCTLPRPKKSLSIVETYSSVQFFDWGMILPGVQVSLKWDLMSTQEFNILDQIFAAGGTTAWESGIQGKTYLVLMASFDGELINGSDGDHRANVSMEIYIVEEVK